MVAMATMATMTTPNIDDTIEWALEDGGGEGAGAPSASTVITNFIWWAEQWSATPQTYHFLPSVFSWMISFPVESASFFGGKVQSLKSVPFTLKMLCFVLS